VDGEAVDEKAPVFPSGAVGGDESLDAEGCGASLFADVGVGVGADEVVAVGDDGIIGTEEGAGLVDVGRGVGLGGEAGGVGPSEAVGGGGEANLLTAVHFVVEAVGPDGEVAAEAETDLLVSTVSPRVGGGAVEAGAGRGDAWEVTPVVGQAVVPVAGAFVVQAHHVPVGHLPDLREDVVGKEACGVFEGGHGGDLSRGDCDHRSAPSRIPGSADRGNGIWGGGLRGEDGRSCVGITRRLRAGTRERNRCSRKDTFPEGARAGAKENGRGNWRSFEPRPQGIAAYLPTFMGPQEPFMISVENLVRLSA